MWRAPFERSVEAAIAGGVDYLLQQQDRDSFWREFDLQPGASESWTTAWVGWCLSGTLPGNDRRRAKMRDACARAAATVCRARRDGGWGYNSTTGPDADTTSWVLRFLNASGFRVEPTAYLAPYVDAGGFVHTFREPNLGSWTDAHDDVAANAGLALLATPASRSLADRVRRRRLARGFSVDTFWWSTSTYGTAWTLRFLSASGAVPGDIARSGREWIANLPESGSSFEVAHRMMAAVETQACGADGFVNQLLDLRESVGWPGSSFLLVPNRETGYASEPNPELRGLLTTALCVRLLTEWVANRAARTT
jgi:hypothetical protein